MNKVASITVSRKGSQRIKNKWSKKIGKHSLILNKITQLKQCKQINIVYVGTNISEVEQICKDQSVEHIWREEYYCDESKCSANEMIYDMCNKVEADIIVWAHCTNPLVSPETYDRAVVKFLENEKKGYDSLLSVNIVQEHLWSSELAPMNYDPKAKRHILAKQLPKLYKQDGAIFIQRKKDFLKNSYFFGDNPFLFILEERESKDINTEVDLKIANLFKELK